MEINMENDNQDVILREAAEDLIKKQKTEAQKDLVFGICAILAFLLIWEIACRTGIAGEKMLVTPTAVVKEIIIKFTEKAPEGATLQQHIWSSFMLAITGFFLALIIGWPLGLLMGWYKPIDKFIRPIFEIIRPLPPIAWIPIIIILLGIGTVAKSFIIFFTTFVPILINAYTGMKETSITHINYAKTCGYSNFRIFMTVGIPSAMPLSFAGMKIALGNGWSTLIAAEMLAASKGLGFMISMGRAYGRVDVILSGMVVIGVIGLLLSGVIGKVENIVLKWRISR